MNLSIFKNKKTSFVELRYLKDVTSCQKMHLHDEITITAIKEGSLNINFKNSSFTIQANTFLIINKDISHNAIVETFCKSGYVMYLDTNYLNINNLYFNQPNKFLKNDTFIEICKILLDDKISVLEKEEHILDFCMKTFSYDISKESNINKLALQIREYLDDNYLENLLLDEIAKKFSITVTHLIRVFKKEFELTIHSYILNKKVHKAKQLLTSDLPINEIALECGFFDLNHLNKNFKKVFQITPKQFQKNIKC